MSILSKLKTQENVADERDSLGGGGGVLDSGLYELTIEYAYITVSQGGAVCVNFHFVTDDGRKLRSQQWVTSSTAKGGSNTYTDKQGKLQYLPGFLMANAVALLTVGKELSELDTEQKVISLYNFEAKAEVPTKVDMITELLGKKVLAGVIKQTVNKNVKDDSGNYVPSTETRDENEIDKIFRASDKKTTAEIRAQADEAVFYKQWEEKWAGQVRDRTVKDAKAVGTPGTPKTAMANKAPARSLFANAS